MPRTTNSHEVQDMTFEIEGAIPATLVIARSTEDIGQSIMERIRCVLYITRRVASITRRVADMTRRVQQAIYREQAGELKLCVKTPDDSPKADKRSFRFGYHLSASKLEPSSINWL